MEQPATIDRPATRDGLAVFLVGERPRPDSPSMTLAKALRSQGILVNFEADAPSTRRWLRLARTSDVMILVAYRRFGARRVVRLVLGVLMGRPLIRRWAGSDVLNCLENWIDLWFAKCLNRFVSLNLVPAPHLREELASIGISAVVIPTNIDPHKISKSHPAGLPAKRILAYIPDSRSEFYGEAIVRQASEANPDVEFLVVGCEDRERFDGCPNVRVLGWVSDMAAVYDQVGCLLRITRHDGLPRMVLESLLQGKYVIFSWPMPGCWYARDFDQVQDQIRRFRETVTVNHEGMEATRRLLDPDPAARLTAVISRVVHKGLPRANPVGFPSNPIE
jgi:hypothetical protein